MVDMIGKVNLNVKVVEDKNKTNSQFNLFLDQLKKDRRRCTKYNGLFQ